jgi:gliding motility-associated-like protein
MKKLLIIAALFVGTTAVAQEVYIPNSFSPNGDGLNDIWKPVFSDTLSVKQYDLQIFDRNGVLVFWTNDPTDGWDGLPFDTTYVYTLTMKWNGNLNGISKSGFIKSIR